ncbi:MAG: GntR family transcriptional regulator [candidate division Zixibacteria bacterium]|nr:GntR family transcriptional regulator [Gammaproteobacteria bacterium]NIT54237.1 GntR family transcriptional regulator [candidate division Zixibacteria bacterium]NIW39631.1 GntR family transcriptional regulator [candidate division Zixibacteria bacterium]NIX57061.1 GntR family transcriptional regulator [candidate division Zixibacteria bacterium]
MAIDFKADTPIYMQISEMIRKAILAGDIQEEEPIPSVRQISVEQNLNPQTVLNATQVLLNENLIEKRRGLGMYVQKGAREKLQHQERESFQEEEIPDIVQRARLLGYSESELVEIVENAYREES